MELPEVQQPVSGRSRIEVLDVLRGLAILGIFYMNLPLMLGPMNATLADPRAFGWAPADRATWLFLTTFVEGTQRGLLEFLFGAALLIIARNAMEPDGPVGAADLWLRRNMWLLVFGLVDVFVLLWSGDILHVYAIAGLFLFPFRRLPVRALLGIGLAIPLAMSTDGMSQYASRVELLQSVSVAQGAQGQLSEPARAALAEWDRIKEQVNRLPPEVVEGIEREAAARSSSFDAFAAFHQQSWTEGVLGAGLTVNWVLEAFSAMLIGMALFKLGVLQGQLSAKEYLVMAGVAYGFGLTLRYIGGLEQIGPPELPQSRWFMGEFTRLAVTVGHVAVVNLAMKAVSGRALLAPFKAAGRMAFSIYFTQQAIGIFLLASPIGLQLPTAMGWASASLLATLIGAILLIGANVWLRYFASGPLEWLWRTLAYVRPMPFLRER